MNEGTKAILATIGIVLFIGVGMWAFEDGTNKGEIVECKKWQSEAAQYSGFYLTKWEAEQCVAHNIIINAPIK